MCGRWSRLRDKWFFGNFREARRCWIPQHRVKDHKRRSSLFLSELIFIGALSVVSCFVRVVMSVALGASGLSRFFFQPRFPKIPTTPKNRRPV